MYLFYHLKIFLRNLRRNATYSVINIGGLTIGIIASVFIFLWVHHERSFDRCYPDTERIYRVTNTITFGDVSQVVESSPLPFVEACKSDIPEIEAIAVMLQLQQIEAIKVNNTVFSVKGNAAYTDRAWLEMFHNQLVEGSFEAYGNHPFSVALTESGANKYFGDRQAIGQIIRINNADYMVQAVVKDNPSNSSLRYQIMVSSDAVLSDASQRRNLEQWGWNVWITFVKLRPDADVSQVAQKMTDIYANKYPPVMKAEASLRMLADIHFETDVKSEIFVHGSRKTVSIFSVLGILLLCTACINYINLTTARVTMRSKEVGVKKIVGAKRLTLFLQFIAESFVICFIATMIALYLILIFALQYHSLAGNVAISFSSPVIWTIAGIALLFTTILNGIYPALILSSFQPINILKGISFSKIKNSSLRKVLVVFQFTLSAALIICVIVIYKQTLYMQNIDPGYHKDQMVRVKYPVQTLFASGEMLHIMQTFKGELQSRPEIADIAMCNDNIENIRGGTSGNVDWNGRAEDFNPPVTVLKVDADFIRVFGLKLVEGRGFTEGEGDMQNVILNETAVRELKILEPYIGQRFDLMGMKGSVIGVVKDFHFRSLHEKITPLVIYQQDPYPFMVAMKINSVKAIREIEAIWEKFFPNDPFEYEFIDDVYRHLYQSELHTSRLLLTFCILIVLIAMLGLYGLSTFAIERRTKEIGIRKVFGASVADIVIMLTRDFFILVAIAFVIAAPVAWWVMSRWLENFAYRIDITAWIFIAGAVITLIIALVAIGIQAVKAATANPVKALKMV